MKNHIKKCEKIKLTYEYFSSLIEKDLNKIIKIVYLSFRFLKGFSNFFIYKYFKHPSNPTYHYN